MHGWILMRDGICVKYGHDYQLDLDGQVTCSNCGSMDDELDNSGQIPVPEAMFESQIDFE